MKILKPIYEFLFRKHDIDFMRFCYAMLKAVRQKMAAEAQKAKLQKTSLSYLDQLAVEERANLARIKSLKRSCI